VQAHNLPDFLVFAGLLPKLSGSRLVLDLHDLMPEFYAARFHGNMKSLPVRMLFWEEALSCRFADRVITVTEIWRQTLIRRGVPAQKVSVVMNVANQRVFHRAARPEAAHQGNGCFELMYHGQVTERYGIDLAIRAVGLLKEQIPGLRLTVHGRGDYVNELMALTEELGLKTHVRFSTQFVPTPELPNLIRGADLGVVPYRRDVFTDEILPTKLMEYAAMGIPAIAARTSGISAYFDENMVQFFKPEDVQDLSRAILLLYRDRVRLAQLARNSDSFNQRYSWEKVASQYVELVDALNRK
jgi:glycosyltransferase involved in cell wall biosynthesis